MKIQALVAGLVAFFATLIVLLVVMAGLSPAHAAPSTGCLTTSSHHSRFDACKRTFSIDPATFDRTLVLHEGGTSGHVTAQVRIPHDGHEITVPQPAVVSCENQWDVTFPGRADFYAGSRYLVPGCSTPTPTRSTSSTPPTSTSTTSHPSPSSSSSTHGTTSRPPVGTPTKSRHGGGSGTVLPSRSETTVVFASGPELAATGTNRAALVGLSTVAGLLLFVGAGMMVLVRRRGTH